MTYGNEPRRKRSTGSSRRDETDEADNWLAGLRGGRSDEPDPFSSPADPFDEPSRGPASTLRSTEPPTRPFQPPPGRGAPPTYDDSSPIAESNGASRNFPGSFSGVPAGAGQFPGQSPPVDDESPSRGTGRRRARDDDESPSRSRRARESSGGSSGGYEEPPALRPRDYEEAFGSPPGYPPPGPPSGYAAPPAGRRAARERIGEEHSVYDVPAYPPAAGRRSRSTDESPSGGRRARPDDVPAQPRSADYESPSGRVGRRRARNDDDAPERFNGFAGGPETTGGFNGFAAGAPEPSAGYNGFAAGAPEPSAGYNGFAAGAPEPSAGYNGFAGGAPEPGGPRSFAASTSYDHGPTLEPIIKPMTGPVAPPDEPPPLVPIFPGLSQPAPVRDEPVPAREDSRWARSMRADEPVLPRDMPRDVPRDMPRDVPRDFESRTGDPRTADRRYGYDDDRAGYAADPSITQAWRPAAASASAAPAQAGPYAPATPPAPANGNRRPDGFYGPGGDYTGEFTSGGSRRPPRQPGGPGTLERSAGPAGRGPRSMSPTIDPVKVAPEQHRPHKWIAVISVIGVLALVAVCGLGTWFMINDERKGPAGTQAAASQSPASRDISSRKADPAPLTQAEVFPNTSIQAAPNEAPYIVLSTAIAPDCSTGATDDLAKLLAAAGCTQVVRGTMKSPTGDYLVTAGLFNLNDQKAAADAFNAVKPIVDGQKGRFVGMSAGTGTGTDAITRAPTQLSWNYRGHFIAYAVIARTDGQAFAAADPYPNQITFDIVETYLENGIIGGRATVPPKPSAAASMLPPSPGKS